MRIVFATTQHASNVAKGLRRFLAGRDRRLSLIDSKDLAARMYGYADWAELNRSLAGPGSPFDHLVSREEAGARRAQYRDALTAHGIPADIAEEAIDAARPTALPEAFPPLDIMRGPQADRLGVAGFDATGFNMTEGGSRFLRAMRAAAAGDPHWARRGGLRAHVPDDPWIVRTLSDMRASPLHDAWAPLAVLCLAELARLLTGDHPYAGPLLPGISAALAANDPGALSEVLRVASNPGVLSLVAHADDLLPILLGRHSPFPQPGESVTPPEVRQPWRPRHPLDVARPSPPSRTWTREDLAAMDLFEEGMPAAMLLRVSSGLPVRTFGWLLAAAAVAGHDLAAGPGPASGPLERDDVVLAAGADGIVLGAVVIRSRADPARAAFHLDVTGPFPVGTPGPGTTAGHVEAFLLAAAVDRFEDDLQTWGRTVPPGGRLSIFVSPAREATDAFLRRFVRVAGERYDAGQREMPDLGMDLVVRNATRDGRPAPLPDLHLATVPEEAAAAWRRFEAVAAGLSDGIAGPVVARLRPDGLDVLGGDGKPLPDRTAVPEALATPASVDAVRYVVAEAGLGPDACVLVAGGFTAVIARASFEDRDWSGGRGICLVVGRRPLEGERERLLNRFWAAFPGELDGILAAARDRAGRAGFLVPGPARPQ
jgi:hypothetical protein